MNAVLAAPRGEISKWAPRFETVKIDKEQIGLIIGPGGKNIRGMQDQFKTTITVEEDGTIKIFGLDGVGVQGTATKIKAMTTKPDVGARYKGKIGSMREFGAFVEFSGGQEAMIHVSELAEGYVEKPEDVVKVGDEIEFEVIAVDAMGKIKGSRKAVILKDRGETYVARVPGGRGGRDRDRGGRGGRDRGGDRGGHRDRAPRGDRPPRTDAPRPEYTPDRGGE
jgi:polyribonucleotide nucleotidyltransferase